MINPLCHFFVAGNPASKGSTRTFWRGGKLRTVNACRRESQWADNVRWIALAEWRPRSPLTEQVCVELEFLFHRPSTCRGTPNVGRIDVDKAIRSVLDALTTIIYRDDRQVLDVHARKRYAEGSEAAGVHITVGLVEAA